MKTYNQFINELMKNDLVNPLINTDKLFDLDHLYSRIKRFISNNNKTMSAKLDIEKMDGKLSKIILTSKFNDNKIELTNNGTTDDFYIINVN